MISERSFEKIDINDLNRLANIAYKDRVDFFLRYPNWAVLYAQKILCVALCQGAALHFIDGKNGIKDFDVWTFYVESKKPFPYRRLRSYDFGMPKFGKTPGFEYFIGRKVDLIGRSIPIKSDNPIKNLIEYLSHPRTKSARELSKKGIVILEPTKYIGKIVWQKEHL